MGLDMYLNKTKKVEGHYLVDLWPGDLKKNDPSLYNELSQYIVQNGSPDIFTWDSFNEEIGYWRKANHIHNWFVCNVQHNIDDCSPYEVSKEQITLLYELCEKVINNNSLAEELLPTTGGFFFGGTSYDEYYFNSLVNTMEICKKIIDDFDFDEYVLTYQSSW